MLASDRARIDAYGRIRSIVGEVETAVHRYPTLDVTQHFDTHQKRLDIETGKVTTGPRIAHDVGRR